MKSDNINRNSQPAARIGPGDNTEEHDDRDKSYCNVFAWTTSVMSGSFGDFCISFCFFPSPTVQYIVVRSEMLLQATHI